MSNLFHCEATLCGSNIVEMHILGVCVFFSVIQAFCLCHWRHCKRCKVPTTDTSAKHKQKPIFVYLTQDNQVYIWTWLTDWHTRRTKSSQMFMHLPFLSIRFGSTKYMWIDNEALWSQQQFYAHEKNKTRYCFCRSSKVCGFEKKKNKSWLCIFSKHSA